MAGIRRIDNILSIINSTEFMQILPISLPFSITRTLQCLFCRSFHSQFYININVNTTTPISWIFPLLICGLLFLLFSVLQILVGVLLVSNPESYNSHFCFPFHFITLACKESDRNVILRHISSFYFSLITYNKYVFTIIQNQFFDVYFYFLFSYKDLMLVLRRFTRSQWLLLLLF